MTRPTTGGGVTTLAQSTCAAAQLITTSTQRHMADKRNTEKASAERAYMQSQTRGALPPDIPASQGWDTSTKRTVLIIMLVGIVAILWISRRVIPWVILAAIVSYLLIPVVDLLTRLRIPRTVATLLIFAIVLIILILLPVFLVPVLVQQGSQVASFDVTAAASSFLAWLMRSLNELPIEINLLGISIPTGAVAEQIRSGFQQFTFVPTMAEVLSYLQQAITTATGIVSSTAALSVAVVGRIFSGVITALVIFFLSLYITKDFPSIRRYVEGLFPTSYQPELRELFLRIGYIWSSFFRGQIILSLVIGTLTWFVMSMIGMPGALLLGIVAGALEVIPNIGPIIATIPAVIIALLQGSSVLGAYGVSNVAFALIVIAISFLIQQAEGNILVPRIIGDSVNLHPVVVIVGVAVGFSAFGVLGAFLAAPTLATGRVVGGYVHAKLLDYPPFLRTPQGLRRRAKDYRFSATGEELAAEAHKAAPALTEAAHANPAASTPEADGGERNAAALVGPDSNSRVSSSAS